MKNIQTGLDNTALWIKKNEGILLLVLIACHGLLLFFIHGYLRIDNDNPPYTDPAINYLLGRGFSSTCWYTQGEHAFWAGNVPLHQFLLIPWLKIFGLSFPAVIGINFVYVAAGMVLLWAALERSGFIQGAEWRLGAITFFLYTDCAYCLLTSGRYDQLSFLLVGIGAFLFTIPDAVLRLTGLVVVAAILPWAHLATALFSGILGVLLLLFYTKTFRKEVLCLSLGGVIGGLSLCAFYHHLGVWNEFLASIAPHMGSINKPHWTRGGLDAVDLPFLGCATVFLLMYRLCKRDECRFLWFVTVFVIAVPAIFLATGVFTTNYAWYLLLPLIFFLAAQLAKKMAGSKVSLPVVVVIVILGLMVPGGFLRKTIKNRLLVQRAGDPTQRVKEFADRVFRPGDVVWVSQILYYEAKKRNLKVFSGAVVFPNVKLAPYPGEEKDLEAVTIYIWGDVIGDSNRLNELPGQWACTGEKMSAMGVDFFVYRRAPPPQ